MAIGNWWQPWSFETYNQELLPYETMNWLLPWMAPTEQSRGANWLQEQSTQGAFPTDLSGYKQPPAATGAQRDWLSQIGQFDAGSLPRYAQDSPEMAWLGSLSNAGKGLNPGMSRQQQREWNQNYGSVMASAPNDQWSQIGQMMYRPTLQRPEYGQAAPLGQYMSNYRTKGGLVANPWYI